MILNNVSGEFRGGELSGILGQSGSGKTSLINCISSYISKNVSGTIEIPKKNFKIKYIMQDDQNFALLTVHEALQYSLKFKIKKLIPEKCHEKIVSILDKLGIAHTMNHIIASLSSGEQRRLSIGLELVDDPKIMFLDEPTTGLDASSSVQCIKLLKNLAMEGRTIVCTIHQPSSYILKIFNQIYAMSNGYCIYQGDYENLFTFLIHLDLICPNTSCPSEYLLELSAKNSINFVNLIRNGKNVQYRGDSNNNNNDEDNNASQLGMIDSDAVISHIDDPKTSQTPSFSYFQLINLIARNVRLMLRDKSNGLMRVAINLIVGLLIGILYRKRIGNDANEIFNEFRFIFILCGFCAYGGFYSLMVKCELSFYISMK